MRLKGLIWFFAIFLIIVSVWELSYTWVVHNFENKQEATAKRLVASNAPQLKGADKDSAIDHTKDSILKTMDDKAIFPVFGTTYKTCKDNELHLGLDLQGGLSVTLDVSLENLVRSLSNNPKD